MIFLDNQLTAKEAKAAKETLADFPVVDKRNIGIVLTAVDSLVEDFATKLHYQDSYVQETFTNAYLVGSGTRTPEGKDVDLLVATNIWYTTDMPHFSIIAEDIRELTHGKFNFKIVSDLPNNYNVGRTEGKGIIKLAPVKNSLGGSAQTERPIDIILVRSAKDDTTIGGSQEREKYVLKNESEFLKRDVNANGQPLPKTILYRRTTSSG